VVIVGAGLLSQLDDVSSMKPNEWGDFFAGVFSPLAFLWLVLGYLQQGEELKLSTQALLLQADELKNSVEQQRDLVEVSRLRVESERESLAYERAMREDAAKPKILVASAGGSFSGNGTSRYNMVITNTGNTATELFGELTVDSGATFHLLDMPFFGAGAEHRTSFEVDSPLQGETSRLRLTYKDTLGRKLTTLFSIGRKSDDPHSDLEFMNIAS